MSLQHVKEEIWKEGQNEARRRLQAAKHEADAMHAKAEQAVRQLREEYAKKARQLREEIERREVAAARLEARARLLQFKKDSIDDAFQKAAEKLRLLPEAKRKEYLGKLFEAAGPIEIKEISCSSRDKHFFKAGNIREAAMLGGFIAKSKDGSYQLDFSFESLLQTVKEQHLAEIADAVFGGSR
ncbi:MAG TPA: V-type ATP synthase subunit E family protein [Candidatus Nanoarchaeia archaeon]|nr:V-type ATP synthase subunit E family protein [Candidatus Nanoarchaeia archaeon]